MIPSHPNQNGYHQEKNAGDDSGEKNPYTLLVGM
jgi:hypothetical protein